MAEKMRTEGLFLNIYKVVFLEIISDGNEDSQLSGFEMFYDDGASEVLLYTNTGDFGNGTFFITLEPPITANAIIIKRPVTITLCEVEVYQGKSFLAVRLAFSQVLKFRDSEKLLTYCKQMLYTT